MSSPFITRVLDYASRTGIKIEKVPRLQSWSRLGLPDMRGFAPHLRVVNVSLDQSSRIQKSTMPKSISDSDLWLIHDLLHIVFYDFATFNLGRKEWKSPDRFIEVHLASEAFAVLALDYHHLIFTDKRGLAVNLDFQDWPRFQLLEPDLPDLNSFSFSKTLLDYYLSGAGILSMLRESAGRGKYTKKLSEWIGHEQRYATKQRFYVMSWLEDLQAKKISSDKAAVIEDSMVAEPLWGLLQLIHYAPDDDWNEYIQSVAGMPGISARVKSKVQTKNKQNTKSGENYFSQFSKYKRQNFPLDFRFTDSLSLSKTVVAEMIEQSTEPSASSLFLFWQIISEASPSLLSAKEKAFVRNLAIESQSLKISKKTWLPVQTLAAQLIKKRSWKPDPRVRSTFFLP